MDFSSLRINHSLQSKIGEEPTLADKLAGYMEDPHLATAMRDKEIELFSTLNESQKQEAVKILKSLKDVKLDSLLSTAEVIKLRVKLHFMSRKFKSKLDRNQLKLYKELYSIAKDLIEDRNTFRVGRVQGLIGYLIFS